ncbi:MAG: hypothetical protein M5U12_06770 [Verrucomicrobia bacterium]|nr:hypothetical protein [Verrucomicrobiota bacterium]
MADRCAAGPYRGGGASRPSAEAARIPVLEADILRCHRADAAPGPAPGRGQVGAGLCAVLGPRPARGVGRRHRAGSRCDDAWPWFEAEDYLLLRSPEAEAVEAFELAQVESVNGVTFTLKAALVGTWPAGTWAWPLVFGRLTFSDLSHRTDWHAGVTVTLAELAVRPDPPAWVDICFLDPWGGCESWGNVPDQQFPAPFNPDSAFLVEQAYTCLDPWTYTFWAVRGAAVRWTLANFSYVGTGYTVANETFLIEFPPGFPTVMEQCLAVSFGSAGGYETWRNLPDDEIEGSWDGEKNDLNPDWTVGGMPLWVPTVMT